MAGTTKERQCPKKGDSVKVDDLMFKVDMKD